MVELTGIEPVIYNRFLPIEILFQGRREVRGLLSFVEIYEVFGIFQVQ
jgi:hypothetical protein